MLGANPLLLGQIFTDMKRSWYLMSALSGVLLGVAWLPGSTGLWLLVAWLPLLWAEDKLWQQRREFRTVAIFRLTGVAFGLWNLIATWWIYNASPAGLVAAVVVNTMLMSTAFWGFHLVKRVAGYGPGYFAFIVFWIVYEHFYLHAEISWPWLTLGYAFANDVRLVQWYEYTGSLGGSLWVLLIAVMAFSLVREGLGTSVLKKKKLELVALLVAVCLPMGLSLVRYYTYTETPNPKNIVVVQPNIDPYEKFVAIPSEEQTQIMIDLAQTATSDSTHYVVCPETAINNDIWIENLEQVQDIRMIRKFVQQHPQVAFITGITCYQRYGRPQTPTARPLGNSGYFYDSFNSAILLDTTPNVPIYHKSLLVTGVEKMPYPQYLGWLKKLTLKLGGTFRSHGTQEERENLYLADSSLGVAPVICYESVFGEFVTDYIKKGAGYIFVITNDGWWGNTPGHKQHFAYSRLRAIETRRSVARSANTGISGFINQRGDVLQSLGWWQRGVLTENLNANNELTYYVQHGDYLARIARFMGLLLVLYTVVRGILGKSKNY